MSDLKPRGIPVELDGVERHLLFTLNIIDEIQDRYEKNIHEVICSLGEERDENHVLRELVTILLNDEAKRSERLYGEKKFEKVTEKDVGEMIGLDNYWEVTAKVMQAYGISIPEADEDDPNGESRQTNN